MQEIAFPSFKFQTCIFWGGDSCVVCRPHGYPPLIYYLTEKSLFKKCSPPQEKILRKGPDKISNIVVYVQPRSQGFHMRTRPFSYPEPFLRAVNGAQRGALAKSISNWHLIGYNEGYCSNNVYIFYHVFMVSGFGFGQSPSSHRA